MTRLETRRADDGRGPYRWYPVIRIDGGLAIGTIYDRESAQLSDDEVAFCRDRLQRINYELRTVA